MVPHSPAFAVILYLCHLCPFFFFFFFYLSPDTNNKGITAKALCSWTLFLGRKWFAFHACSEWQQEACLLLVCCFGLREGGWIAPCTSDRKTHHLSSWTIDLNSHDNSLFLIIHLHGGKGPEFTLFLLLTSPQPKIDLHVGRQVGKLHTTFKLAWTAHYYNIIWSGLWVCSDCLLMYGFTNASEPLSLKFWLSRTVIKL